MSLLSTEHINAIFNKVKALVFGTNNIADGAITKEKIDVNLLNEIAAAKTDSTNLKNIIIHLPDDTNLGNIDTIDITESSGLYVPDFEATVGNYNFLRKLTPEDIVNIAINGCAITLVKGSSLIEAELIHCTSMVTRINNNAGSQTCTVVGFINKLSDIMSIMLLITFYNTNNYTISYMSESKNNLNPVYVQDA